MCRSAEVVRRLKRPPETAPKKQALGALRATASRHRWRSIDLHTWLSSS
jgi:hypothetical protein